MKKIIDNSLDARTFSAKVKNLALLPADDIPHAFNSLVEKLSKIEDPVTIAECHVNGENIPLTATLSQIFKPFIDYYKRFWLNIITPKRFSIFNEKCRTDNDMERYNRSIRIYTGIRPCSITFVGN